MRDDFIFRGSVNDFDPELAQLVSCEDRRQEEAIILVASESASPEAVQELMGSTFGNIYAEGYPREASRRQSQEEILDIEAELAYYRRNSDPRYYKGVEFADILEALARRRAAELFAANGLSADQLYINVQPLSGSPANLSVYNALLEPEDTILGLDLNHGGHLTHGSRVNRSGKRFNTVGYTVDPETEILDMDAVEALALEVKPRLIVAGFTAYPLQVNWARFRDIADKCGAYLMADIAHISGLVAAGIHPSPIGIADVVTTTTHKSLCGPRGAMIMTHRRDLARKIDRAVFPGDQGGPHLNTIAALAVALKLARSDRFKALQQRVVDNAGRLARKLEEHGLRIVGGGSKNHLLLIDTKSVSKDGVHLSGDMAARILDAAGIVTNRNTIPSDRSAFASTGIRIGTVWVSQLGYGPEEIDLLAEAIATIMLGCIPFTYPAPGGKKRLRAKVDPAAFQKGRQIVRQLTGHKPAPPSGAGLLVRGSDAAEFLNLALTAGVAGMEDGDSLATGLFGPDFEALATLQRQSADRFLLQLAGEETAQAVRLWLQDLSDGYLLFDDPYAKLPGPVVVETADIGLEAPAGEAAIAQKPYYVGWQRVSVDDTIALPEFSWEEPEEGELQRTSLHAAHVEMGGRMVPFAGWDMPVWYSSVSEEHQAVRETAGLFDVSHMGVFEASGRHVVDFLNLVTTNDVSRLKVGRSHYTYFLLPDGSVVDDLLIYRRGPEKFMLVVNAANNDKDWAWLNAVNEGQVQIDPRRPALRWHHAVTLRDLRDPQWADECRVDIALQGPRSKEILLRLTHDPLLAARIKKLPWAGLTEGILAGCHVVISRTGYTGERVAYELFVHPDKAPHFWQALLEAGEPLGLKPCGLAARDSTRTEAGLPLYGHELAGPLGLNPGDAGFASYVKLWKPFFIGREAYIAHEEQRQQVVARFRMDDKGVRRTELGDPIVDRRGKMVGTVTSCAIDQEGYLLGQALLPLDLAKEGTSLAVYPLGGGKRPLRTPAKLKPGARLPVPDSLTVLSRFP